MNLRVLANLFESSQYHKYYENRAEINQVSHKFHLVGQFAFFGTVWEILSRRGDSNCRTSKNQGTFEILQIDEPINYAELGATQDYAELGVIQKKIQFCII